MKIMIKFSVIFLFLLFITTPVLSIKNNVLDSNFSKLYDSWYTLNINDVSIKKGNLCEYNNSTNNLQSSIVFQGANKSLEIPTYDGSGQLTHPSVLYFPEGWNGHKYWAVATPYPNSDDGYENPSIYCFDNPGENWKIPAGLKNPVIPKPSVGFNSDPCLGYNRTSDELYCIYREYNSTDLNIKYLLIKSSDGISWSNPVLLYNITGNEQVLTHDTTICERIFIYLNNIINPKTLAGATNIERSNAIVQLPNGTWMMWAQKWDSTYSIIYRTSVDCLQWSEPKNCSFIDSFYDKTVWHIDVKYIPKYKRFLMIQYDDNDKCLRVAESRDGIKWKYYSKTILEPDKNTTNFANSHLYKSSITYDSTTDTIHLWYVGVNTKSEWKIGYTNISYSRLQNFLGTS